MANKDSIGMMLPRKGMIMVVEVETYLTNMNEETLIPNSVQRLPEISIMIRVNQYN